MLKHGSSVDILASEFAVGYEGYLRDSEDKGHKINHGHSQAELQDMLNKVKGKRERKD